MFPELEQWQIMIAKGQVSNSIPKIAKQCYSLLGRFDQ